MRQLTTLFGIMATLTFSTGIRAENFPNRPVSIVVPYSAGGPVDIFSRALGLALQSKWKQPVLVINKAGANEIIGADFVAKSPADGYTIFAGTDSALTMNPHLYKKLPYNVDRDFAPITRMVTLPLVFFVNKDLPVNNLKEFIALAKQSKNRPLSYGSSGTGGHGHLPMVAFAKQENIELLHTPYRGASNIIPDVISGQINAATLGVPVLEQHIKNGSIKALAISANERSKALPELQTFEEQGIKDIGSIFTIGLLAPKKTPRDIVEKIYKDVNEILNKPEFLSKNIENFGNSAIAGGPVEFQDFIKRESIKQAERVKSAGVTLD